eukprot:CAMPEP_0168611960 /NCGR_PEP_ID=MMETSP0449_2-20121227/2647_1 /TAXON_ID=1082188 /ORGANISM="Strombidium rassoulzadegani, Strain ras09" /LENGTH=62 /DNA_ID=CAMNT_0008652463 /DNA_START=216 /DNA_END=401 /DNA_ORIENTATION=+
MECPTRLLSEQVVEESAGSFVLIEVHLVGIGGVAIGNKVGIGSLDGRECLLPLDQELALVNV